MSKYKEPWWETEKGFNKYVRSFDPPKLKKADEILAKICLAKAKAEYETKKNEINQLPF